MSLNQPLAKPLSLPLAKPLTGLGQDYFDAVAALGECWPLTNTLAGSEGTPITLTRASAAIYEDVYGKYQKFATNIPALSGGWLDVSGQIQNKCTNYNLNPDAGLTNITVVSGAFTFTREDRSTELRALGFGDLIDSGEISGLVVVAECTTAGAFKIEGVVGNTNPHSTKIWIDTYGATYNYGLSGDQESITTSGLTLIEQNNKTPSGIGNFLTCTSLEVGEKAAFFANMLTETSTVPESLIECAGAAGTQALDDVQVSTTGWAVNDCSLAGAFIYRGSTSAFPAFFSSEVDVNNRTRLAFNPASPNMTFQKRVAGTNYTATVSLSTLSVNDYFEWLAVQDSVNGMTFYVRQNGVLLTASTNANTLGLQLGSTGQIGNVAALANEANGSYAPLARFNSSDVTLEGVFNAC